MVYLGQGDLLAVGECDWVPLLHPHSRNPESGAVVGCASGGIGARMAAFVPPVHAAVNIHIRGHIQLARVPPAFAGPCAFIVVACGRMAILSFTLP